MKPPSPIADRIAVVFYCLLAVLPFVAMKLKLRDREIFGVLPAAPYPALKLSSLRGEQFQTQYTAWFESRLGFKGYSITLDNTLLYHAFYDTKVGSQVALGSDGHMLKDEDLAYFNKDGAELPNQAQVDALADKIARVQAGMQAQHRAFVPLIIPGKTALFRDKVPARWTRDLGDPDGPRPSDVRIYGALKRALDARKVTYVDARAMFQADQAGKIDRDLLWGRTARHWSFYGACLAMAEVARAYGALSGKPALDYDCQLQRKREAKTFDDYDMWRLINAWGVPRTPRLVPFVAHRGVAQEANRPSTLFIGTSFQWTLLKDAEATQLFGPLHFNSYNVVLVEWPSGAGSTIRPHSEEWRQVFLNKDLYVLDLFEVYLFAPNSYVDQTLDQLGAELQAQQDDANDPTSGATIGQVRDLGVTDGRHHFELWGSFPDPAKPYTATIACDGARSVATVYYQNPNGQQLNIHVADPGPGRCDRTRSPPRATGASCTFRIKQGPSIGAPAFGPQRVCPGPQGSSGQDADGQCSVGLAGC